MIKKKNKQKKIVKLAVAYITATLNNTIVTFTDYFGNAICWSSAGACGFKGAKKGTSFAGQIVAKTASVKAKEFNIEKLDVVFSGQGEGRDAALQALINSGFNIISLEDQAEVPYNGCRSPKKRKL